MSKKKTLKIIFAVAVSIFALLILMTFALKFISQSGLTAGPDKMFGDQHLKTTVALIELHKVRYGSYPETLKDLKFTGSWDLLALASVRYCPQPDRSAYFIEVTRGWAGKPTLTMDKEFWQGTGYDPSLKALCGVSGTDR